MSSLSEQLCAHTTIADLEAALLAQLKEWQQKGINIAYVAGVVFSDGPEHVDRNVASLIKYRKQVQQDYKGKVFCASDIFFSSGLFNRLDTAQLPYAERRQRFFSFWRQVLAAGVNDLFMAPGWERSEGARDEHDTAKELGVAVHYIEG